MKAPAALPAPCRECGHRLELRSTLARGPAYSQDESGLASGMLPIPAACGACAHRMHLLPLRQSRMGLPFGAQGAAA